MIVKGIDSDVPQRLPFALAGSTAVSPEWGPSGSVSWNVPIGASGTVAKSLLVMPFLMFTLPTRSTVIPSPCRIATTSGNAAPPWDTRYAGPDTGVARIGVVAVAIPMFDPAGHDAGFAANVASVHACWIVVSRAGSCLGSTTATLWMFASPLGNDALDGEARTVLLAALRLRTHVEHGLERQRRAVRGLEVARDVRAWRPGCS